jgi:hypothetical protein
MKMSSLSGRSHLRRGGDNLRQLATHLLHTVSRVLLYANSDFVLDRHVLLLRLIDVRLVHNPCQTKQSNNDSELA